MSREERLKKQREYYQKNKEKIKQKTSLYQKNNPEKMREYNRKSYEINKEHFILRNTINRLKRNFLFAKRKALLKNIPFNLELDDLIIPEVCPYLGVKLTSILGKGKVDTNWTIDRIVPALGYVKGNVQIISEKANRMKNDATKEELLIFAQNILKLYG